jgi:hypothetical protein
MINLKQPSLTIINVNYVQQLQYFFNHSQITLIKLINIQTKKTVPIDLIMLCKVKINQTISSLFMNNIFLCYKNAYKTCSNCELSYILIFFLV